MLLTELVEIEFQSSPSARRATDHIRRLNRHHAISIHALREEGDGGQTSGNTETGLFQSTPSARRATLQAGDDDRALGISIHALREEGDALAVSKE